MYRAKFFYQFPATDSSTLGMKTQLGEFTLDSDNIYFVLGEAREKRSPIAAALLQAFPALPYVRCSEIEIHVEKFDPQLSLWEPAPIVERNRTTPALYAQ